MLSRELDHAPYASYLAVPVDKPSGPQQAAQAETAFLLVRGMDCPACALRVRNALLQIEGVVTADVDLSRGLAKVWYDPGALQPETLAARLPVMAGDARRHYTAHLIVIAGAGGSGAHLPAS